MAPAGAKDRSDDFRVSSRDTLLGEIIARINFDDGSHLSIVDDSDLVEFIHHHAWFEGDEVALSREDRVCLLGISQVELQRNVEQHDPILVKYSPMRQTPFL